MLTLSVNADSAKKIKAKKGAAQTLSEAVKYIICHKNLYILLLPGLLHYILFRYVPLFGISVAFKDFSIYKGILNSPWIGLANFEKFISSADFTLLLKNTFMLGFYGVIFTFPFPILFAILLSEMKLPKLQKIVQNVSFFPAMLSVVVVCSLVTDVLSPSTGIINTIFKSMGLKPHYFMVDPKAFRSIYIISEIWSTFGYNAIVYLAALTNIDTQLYDAAYIDGCGRCKSIWHVTLPGLMPTICTMFVLNIGNIFKIGTDKIILLFNPMTYSVAVVFGSFVYRKGLIEADYSYATAAGLFESVIAFIFVVAANKISKKLADTKLW